MMRMFSTNRHRVESVHKLLISLMLCISSFTHAAATIPQSERDVLIALYGSTNGAGWIDSTNWTLAPGVMNLPATECGWKGITCDGANEHVTQIDMHANNLIGTLPELSALSKLAFFVAPDNQLTGGIPELKNLSNLYYFGVSNNQLSGNIPELAGLSNLRIFIVRSNRLTGPIPTLTGLTNLFSFSVNGNQLSGQIPDLATLSSLQLFHVNNNQLTGPVPALPQPSALTDGGSQLCPNNLTPAAQPASATDIAWNKATGTTPWSTSCNIPAVPSMFLVASRTISVFGQAIVFTAGVTANSPTGTVTFKDGADVLGTAPLILGAATYAVSTLSPGSHSITAVYNGDSQNLTSTSHALGVGVGKAGTDIVVVLSPGSVALGNAVTASFSVSASPPGAGTPTGNVTVTDGAAGCSAALPATSCAFTPVSVGSKTVTAAYMGDDNFAPSIGTAGFTSFAPPVPAPMLGAGTMGLLILLLSVPVMVSLRRCRLHRRSGSMQEQ